MDSEEIREKRIAESFPLAIALAIVGGFLDAYTYLMRGGVFANAETGNMVLLGVRFFQGEYAKAGTYLVPILAFALGVWASEEIRTVVARRGALGWWQSVLGVEIGVMALVAFLPEDLNMLANSLVAFISAVQMESFRKVEGNPFVSTMCTGNLRSGTEQLFLCWHKRDKSAGRNAGYYYGILAAFIVGAGLGVPTCGILGLRAILVDAGLLAFCLLALTLGAGRKQK